MSKKQTERLPVPVSGKNPYTLWKSLTKGGPVAWLSCLVMGFGNFMGLQIIKGLIFLAIEAAFIWFMFINPKGGVYCLKNMFPLSQRISEPIIEYNQLLGGESIVGFKRTGEFSHIALLYGVTTICLCLLFVFVWRMSVVSGYQTMVKKKAGKRVNSFVDDVKDLFDSKIHNLLMTPPLIGILVFTILPLIYMISMAFTNYDSNHMNNNFEWVGLENFKNVLSMSSSIGKQFWAVVGWTLVWAFFATFLNFFLGTFVAIIINRPTTRLKGLWRGCLSMTIAVPQFVSLLIMRSMLSDQGIINRMLLDAGWISKYIPFLSSTGWARTTVIIINLWVGIPYTIMQVTGILKNIPADLYEAAKIDGANAVQQFTHITLPYMIFVLTPYIITSFTGNINNFNVIFLLSGGNPVKIGNTAGDTDLLVTWLFKLTTSEKDYNLGAVIGIMTFIVLAIVSLVTYRSSGSYKDEEGFK